MELESSLNCIQGWYWNLIQFNSIVLKDVTEIVIKIVYKDGTETLITIEYKDGTEFVFKIVCYYVSDILLNCMQRYK